MNDILYHYVVIEYYEIPVFSKILNLNPAQMCNKNFAWIFLFIIHSKHFIGISINNWKICVVFETLGFYEIKYTS